MGDILRTARRAGGGFNVAASVHLVETSPVLRLRQQEILGNDAQWHSNLEEVPEGPAIFVANEFFDALPIRQFEKRQDRWFERVIGIRDEKLELGLAPAGLGPQGNEGDIIESSPARNAFAGAIGQRLKMNPGAALIIDYGHLVSAPGDTLQAMRGHAHVPVTHAPGDSDLTSHVDFEALGKALRSGGAHVLPPVTQRDFLMAMGLEQRVNNLAQRSDERTAQTLRRQMARLADESQMGNLFKVLAATSPGLQTPYPFGNS
jgi:NADH dehydrogenase [ubiquinone] 1 alpha subcomplex assembly factor 7